jgi:hypothetical protein
MSTKIKQNHDDDELYCVYSKQRIHIGEKYVEITEDEFGDIIIKTYLLEYAPTEDEDDDIYIGE